MSGSFYLYCVSPSFHLSRVEFVSLISCGASFYLSRVGYIASSCRLCFAPGTPARSDDGGVFLPHTRPQAGEGGIGVAAGMPPGSGAGTWSPQWGWYVSMTPPQVRDGHGTALP